MSSLSRTLTETRTELTTIDGNATRVVRDVRREPKNKGNDLAVNEEWIYTKLEFVIRQRYNVKEKCWQAMSFESERRARGVALRRMYFGEGAERLVRKFREVDAFKRFVGPPMVAKESRFINRFINHDSDIKEYHRVFCDTQTRAQNLAMVFNERLAKVPGLPAQTPRVSFVSCSVYTVASAELGTFAVLAEKELDSTKYRKWNDNKGWHPEAAPTDLMPDLDRTNAPFDMIEEGDEDADTDEEADDDDGSPPDEMLAVRDDDIPQAFSCFTYHYTKKRALVCDLQGVLTTNADQSRLFEFTDPVIHFRSKTKKRTGHFGRTDRGRKGIDDFFKTHTCSELCRALKRRWIRGTGGAAGDFAHDANDK